MDKQIDNPPQHTSIEAPTPDKRAELTALVTLLHRSHRPQKLRSVHTYDRVAVSLSATCEQKLRLPLQTHTRRQRIASRGCGGICMHASIQPFSSLSFSSPRRETIKISRTFSESRNTVTKIHVKFLEFRRCIIKKLVDKASLS